MKTTKTGKNEKKLLSNEDQIVSMLNIFKLLFKRRVVGDAGGSASSSEWKFLSEKGCSNW